MYQLWVLGALNNVGGLTELGWKMVEFPMDPPLAKLLLMGEQLRCLDEVGKTSSTEEIGDPHVKGLRKAREVRSQFLDILKNLKIPLTSSWPDLDVVRKVICSAYFHNSSRLKGVEEYINCKNGMPCHLHPSSTLFGMGQTSEYVVYHELVLTTKEYMHCTPSWLAEMGPMFFSVKDSDTSLLEHNKMQEEEKTTR